ncbi:hypothetical protein DPMN_144618 [Dreissena polymorpha]|uniref:Uncharacterized protein n=1 Tax=Dreissena polymorpha TaxID=45954 RepID=A0A9D4F3I8_DREPO|nr:hypothetical protein DPMN_144618 [Dreissena polymorpha]
MQPKTSSERYNTADPDMSRKHHSRHGPGHAIFNTNSLGDTNSMGQQRRLCQCTAPGQSVWRYILPWRLLDRV